MEIPEKVLAAIESAAMAAYPNEACGLLIGRDKHIIDALPSPNRAAAPGAFLIDPKTHLETQRRTRQRGLKIIGCYHSHPGGDSAPSIDDGLGENPSNFLWMITSLQNGRFPETRIFRQSGAKAGPISDRFSQESLHILRFVA